MSVRKTILYLAGCVVSSILSVAIVSMLNTDIKTPPTPQNTITSPRIDNKSLPPFVSESEIEKIKLVNKVLAKETFSPQEHSGLNLSAGVYPLELFQENKISKGSYEGVYRF